MYWTCESTDNLLSYCGLVNARIRASEKDLPVKSAVLSKGKFISDLPQKTTILFKNFCPGLKKFLGPAMFCHLAVLTHLAL